MTIGPAPGRSAQQQALQAVGAGPAYKTQLCKYFPNCARGDGCPFAHGRGELRAHAASEDLRVARDPCQVLSLASSRAPSALSSFDGLRGSFAGLEGVVAHQETQVVHEVRRERVAERPNFDILMAFDTSGSMRGRPIREVQHCAQELIVNKFAGFSDRVGVMTFDTTVRTILPLTFKHRLPDSALLGELACSNRTALNDAIIEGVRTIHGRSGHRDTGLHTHHPYLVILTDGRDNSSRRSFDDAARVLRKPKESGFGGESMAHFHVIFITVGRDAPVAEIRCLSREVPHISHIEAETSTSEAIRAAFRDLVQLVTEHLVISQRTTTAVVRARRQG